ncbi:fluoride efflux transporter FluC [Deefgea piscis]|uniref:fluoride efflux transporter FluC n=1 Tax=Deefgea piscis TaxID=2739061 RepID=UPI001C801DF1|nr:CrcB family protein [Deefgea piscis]QZA82551.1 CrcB family protein [Deefgea piscis]
MVSALDVMWVGLGGGLGSLARWRVGLWIGERYHGVFPWGTLLINVSGAFVIAYLSILFSIDWRERFGTPLNAGVLTGALGGFTTFSTMQLDAAKLTDSGKGKMAAVYLLLSVFAGLLAAILGAWLALLSR